MSEIQHWLSQRYLAYRFLTHLFFVSAIWLYFYRIFITDQQIGLLDAAAFAVGLLAEVPSGALADKFGRGRIVKLGHILAGVGLILQAFGGFVPIFIGQAIMMIGVAFASGADEALFFEKLNFSKDSVDWRKLVTRGSQFGLAGSVIGAIGGGWLYQFSPEIPWILSGIAFISAALVIWSISDTRTQGPKQKVLTEIKDYLIDIKEGFAQFRLPKLLIYVPIIITVQGLFYTAGWGILRLILLDRFHFDPFWGSVAIASSSVVTVAILHFMHKHAEQMSEKHVITLISLSAAASLLLSMADIGLWGFVVILTLYAGEHVLHPFMSEVLNKQAPEHKRATVLSVASFLRTLPYVILAPIIGYLSTHNNLEFFLLIWPVVIGLAVVTYLAAKKKDTQIKVS